MSSSDACVYCGGHGVVVRNHFDGYENDAMKTVVPATFWVNDMVQPSQLYPDIQFIDGVQETPEDAALRASVAFVIGDQLGALLPEIDSIQNDDWGWGVFYATDSNAVDARCRWLGDFNFYDCPHGGFDGNDLDSFLWDDGHSGSGWYGYGNPFAGLGGGGTGPHIGGQWMDQEQARDENGVSLLWDWDAQCNQELSGNDWGDWIDHWFANGDMSKGVDALMCWVNNPRDMIKMSNTIWYHAADGTGDGYPAPGIQAAFNWGWNEIPFDRLALSDPNNWDAVMIHLPAESCGQWGNDDVVDCLCEDCHWRLETVLDQWVDAGVLVPGFENIGYRPGSYVVFAREFSPNFDNIWYRWFFCSYWKSPSGKYEIMSYSEGADDGACFIQWGGSTGSDVAINTQNSSVAVV